MRILHYPPQTGPVDDRVIGIGAHTEYVAPLIIVRNFFYVNLYSWEVRNFRSVNAV